MKTITLKPVKRCGRCGHLIAAEATQCPYCEGSYERVADVPAELVEKPRAERKPMDPATKKKLIYASIGLAGALVLAGVIILVVNLVGTYGVSNDELASYYASQQAEENAGTASARGEVFEFEGLVNGRHNIRGTMTLDGGVWTGKYYYETTMLKYGDVPSTYINIHGVTDESGETQIACEFSNGKKEYWEGSMIGKGAGRMFIGTITGQDGRVYSITLNAR